MAQPPGDGELGIALLPDALDFGEVALGVGKNLGFELRNHGTFDLHLFVDRCFETTREYSFRPLPVFTLEPGEYASFTATYRPTDVGNDNGCLSVQLDGSKGVAVAVLALEGHGVEGSAGLADLDIADFEVKGQARPNREETVVPRLFVRHSGGPREARTATVTGWQGESLVYSHSREVSGKRNVGDVKRWRFPPHRPVGAGDILWEATILDDLPDLDQRLAVTRVIEAATGVTPGLDLDIKRLRVNGEVVAGKGRAKPKLQVVNRGTIDEARPALLMGFQGGVEVYGETVAVADSPDGSRSSRFKFPPFRPEQAGDILWVLNLEDEVPDVDEALAVTYVTSSGSR